MAASNGLVEEFLARDQRQAAEVRKARQNGVGNVDIDVAIVIDVTSSMQPFIDQAKQSVERITREFLSRYGKENSQIRYAVVAYRDIEDQKPREILDFTSSVDKCRTFLEGLEARTLLRPAPEGTTSRWEEDFPEDVTGALYDTAHKLSWKHKCRATIIIGDAPCHGSDFYDLREWGRSDATGGLSAQGNDVAFVLDYSGSMGGAKIGAATASMLQVITDCIQPQDRVSLVHFTSTVTRDLALTPRGSSLPEIRKAIEALQKPTGSTALYDAMHAQLQELESASSGAAAKQSQWLVVLTDGSDNASKMTRAELCRVLQRSRLAGLVIIGVGDDVQQSALRELCAATQKGCYLEASATKTEIEAAFRTVGRLIQQCRHGADGLVRDGVTRSTQCANGLGTVRPDEFDNHPGGDPLGRDPRKIMRLLRQKRVDVHFFRIDASTDRMVQQLAQAYNAVGAHGMTWKLNQHDISASPQEFVQLVLKSINRSVSSSSTRSIAENSGGLVDFFSTKSKYRAVPAFLLSLDEGISEEDNADYHVDADAKKAVGLDAEQRKRAEKKQQAVQGTSCAQSPWETVDVYTAAGKGNSVGQASVRVAHLPFAQVRHDNRPC
jgi:Mg-chelatase subunit ChlD